MSLSVSLWKVKSNLNFTGFLDQCICGRGGFHLHDTREFFEDEGKWKRYNCQCKRVFIYQNFWGRVIPIYPIYHQVSVLCALYDLVPQRS